MKSSRLSAAVGSLLFLTFMLLVASPVAVRSQVAAKSSIQGVWRVTERTVTNPNALDSVGKHANPQPGLYLFTAKHYAQVFVTQDKPRPQLPDVAKATADQLREAWQPFVGAAGTYNVSADNLLTLHPMVTKDQAGMKSGDFQTWWYKLDGNTLTAAQMRTQAGPVANPVSLKFTRVE